MSYFAQIDENDIVVNIIVCDLATIESGRFGDPVNFIETDPKTKFNVHYGEDGQPDGGTPLRGNYACIGEKYDRENDVFYPTKVKFPSWTLSGPDWMWKAPVPRPVSDTIKYKWDEDTLSWIEKPSV